MRVTQYAPVAATVWLCAVLAACGAPDMQTRPASVTSATAPLAQADMAAAKAMLSPDETLQSVDFPPQGSRTLHGQIRGYSSTAYAVPVAAGQTLSVTFDSKVNAAGFNVFDVAKPQEAVHRGEVQGRSATITVPTATTLVIRPFEMRSVARRGTVADYSLTMTRK